MQIPSTALHDHDAHAGKPEAVLDNSYVLGMHGFIYTTSRGDHAYVARHCAVVLVSVDGSLFDVNPRKGPALRGNVAVIGPLVERQLVAPHGNIVGFNVNPTHPLFRHFVAGPAAALTSLPREPFLPWSDALAALHDGSMPVAAAQAVFDEVLAEVCSLIPQPGPRPAHLTPMLDYLYGHTEATIDELAAHLGVTPRRMTQLFRASMGMSFRDHKTWLKQRKVMEIFYSRRSLTNVAHAAGFTDSPQFARAFQRWFGQSPSFSRDPVHVRVRTPEASNVPAAPRSGPSPATAY